MTTQEAPAAVAKMQGHDVEDALSEWSVIPATNGALHVEVAMEHSVVAKEEGELKAVLSVVAPPVDATARAPLRLVAVLDKSGSMHGEKLRLVKETMLFMLRHLSERDALGIVEYDTTVKVAAPLTYCNAAGRERLEAALKRLQAGTQTNLSGGLLKGLELHQGDVQLASAGAQQVPLQRLRVGNTYRRLSDEEAGRKEHFGYPGASPPEGSARVHEWTMELRFDSDEDVALVQKVVYNLHPTFKTPVVEVHEAPFQLTRHGWGTFALTVDLHLKDGRVTTLEHQLRFDQPETFRTVLLPLRSLPAGLDYIVNGTKKVRVTSLELESGVISSRNPDAQGRTLRINGVSYGKWGACRFTTVPASQADVAERIMALFQGKSAEDRVEFSDTDGDSIAFVATERPSVACETELLGAQAQQAVVRSTFIFTDGLANIGITGSGDLCAAAQSALGELGERRCTLSTFGFGKDHNADLLQGLAEKGSGIYSYVDGEDKIGEAFGEALGGLLSTTHQNVCLSLDVASGVGVPRVFTAYQVEGPMAGPGNTQTVRIDLGDLFAEERRDILVSLALPKAESNVRQVLGSLQARGFSVLGKRTETADAVNLTVDRRDGVAVDSCHPQVERHRNRHTATEALEAGRAAAQGGNLAKARKLLADAIEVLGNSRLTRSGDAVCTGLLADLNECLKDLQREDTYLAYGSKKMACMQGAHTRQRACFGQGFSEQYSNSTMSGMKAMFKEQCK